VDIPLLVGLGVVTVVSREGDGSVRRVGMLPNLMAALATIRQYEARRLKSDFS
jgi:hypothetical protein